ncbi:MAG TPA: hypothetical protein VLR26_11730 [Frankiaceae bacterium]|nr:hypothetical protein [Frankiaceae bacterium]
MAPSFLGLTWDEAQQLAVDLHLTVRTPRVRRLAGGGTVALFSLDLRPNRINVTLDAEDRINRADAG